MCVCEWVCVLTIQQLVNKHKVVLDALLSNGGEIGLQDTYHLVEKLKDEGSIYILSCGGHNPDIVATSVKVTGPGNVGDWGPDRVPSVDHIHTKCINICPTVGFMFRHVCVYVCVHM